jgi:hypothetical protein
VVDLVSGLREEASFAGLCIIVVDAAGVELRVRCMMAGADVCFPPGVSYAELQGTLGALVRRTIRSRTQKAAPVPVIHREASSWLALQGDIQDFPLSWLLQVMKYDAKTAAIALRGADRAGVIYLRQGDAVHAQVRGGTRGEAALKEMLGWTGGRFHVRPDARPTEETIRSSIMHLLLTQAVAQDHASAGIFGAVSAD